MEDYCGLKLNAEVVLSPYCIASEDHLRALLQRELLIAVYTLGQPITSFIAPELNHNVIYARPCDFERCKEGEILPNIYFYRLSEEEPQPEYIGGDDETLAANFLTLPSSSLEGLWETLIFDSDLKEKLLQYSKAMIDFSRRGVDPNIVSCNRVLLLHGPPGTGKTSLCKALAQKLSIRNSNAYSQSLLIEINTHSLFSKYFSESGKLVSKMFEKIRDMASDSSTLICVLIDEVESLTHSRNASSSSAEPSDAMRVVNSVLTHLDLMKTYPNVLVLTTSNMTKAIDVAFVDRADLRILISNPSPFGAYSILYSCLDELIRKGNIVGVCPEKVTTLSDFSNLEMNSKTKESQKLINVAKESAGLSGRALRKLPLRVFSTLIPPCEGVTVIHFLAALSTTVKILREEMKSFNTN